MAAALLIAASTAHAAVYKCIAEDGKIEFRGAPCAAGQGGKIDVRPNVIGESSTPELRAKTKEVDERIKRRLADQDVELARNMATANAFRARCQGYADEAARQRAWLYSISPAVRESAVAEINIQRRKWSENKCG